MHVHKEANYGTVLILTFPNFWAHYFTTLLMAEDRAGTDSAA